jgi:SpoIIAA-like
MVEPLPDMPAGTIGFRVSGDVTRADYTSVLVPALEGAAASGAELRTLFAIDDLDEIEPGALWEDSRLGFDLVVRHHGAWRRSAIVTDTEWIAKASRLFGWMIPGEARVFPAAQLAAAKAWIAADGT